MSYEVDDVLKFMFKWRTRKAVEAEFGLSNTESYHLLKRLKKMGEIEELNVRMDKQAREDNDTHYTHHTNRVWLYRAKKSK